MITVDNTLDKVFEELDLSYKLDTDTQELEISTYSPEGQDCYATFKADYMENLLRDMAEWLYAYDADYEASLWIGDDGHGKKGAPYHIKDIVADMDWWRNQIDILHDRLCALDQKQEYTYEMCPHCEVEVEFVAEKAVKQCPNCGKYIVVCSMCDACIKPCALERSAHELNGDF